MGGLGIAKNDEGCFDKKAVIVEKVLVIFARILAWHLNESVFGEWENRCWNGFD